MSSTDEVTEYLWFTGIEAPTIEGELKKFDIKHDGKPKPFWSLQIKGTQANIDKFINKTTKRLEGSTGNIADNKKEVDRVIKRNLPTEVDDNISEIKMLLIAHFSCKCDQTKQNIKCSGVEIRGLDAFKECNLKLEMKVLVMNKNPEAGFTYTSDGVDPVGTIHENRLLEVKFVKWRFPDDGCAVDEKKTKEIILKTLEEKWDAICFDTTCTLSESTVTQKK
jgi:hypothetical protein